MLRSRNVRHEEPMGVRVPDALIGLGHLPVRLVHQPSIPQMAPSTVAAGRTSDARSGNVTDEEPPYR
jgi:hypothetical protein